ncbi:MAG: aminotransferase class I/II-fold pyridoxal phosphate-dependent enzyme, partial [Halobacteriovoraceae bacterium]|nr:aminotransferase class I/II-fold pyridoxal phosphate-dependent enzyme [Halobacteriovoraceae bacterium]
KLGQYAPMPGIPLLTQEIRNYTTDLYDVDYSPSEVTVTNGATEGIMVTCLALLNPGDEVIIFEPFYDSYPVAINLTGAKIKVVTLKGPDFRWDSEELAKAFSDKTKLVIFNNPQNPTGRVFSRKEIEELAGLVKKHDSYILCDEVYEFLTFDGFNHIPMMSLEGMKERTITTSSAGKTFGHTGLKVGWVLAEEKVSKAIRMVHQFNVFSVNPYAQHAVAIGLQNLNTYIPEFKTLYNGKRLLLKEILVDAGFSPCATEGTYFTLVPIPEDKLKEGYDDLSFCQHLIEKNKVATIPPSAFYSKTDEGKKYLRFCFAKSDELLNEARNLLKGN